MATITIAGEKLIAEKIGTEKVLQVTRFIYAKVPGLDPQKPVDRAEVMPPAGQIMHRYELPHENKGFVNPNQVVYSSMLGSDIGDFDWNWLGLETADGVLFAVAYVPLQQKRRNIPPRQIGNNITRNILVEFTGAQALTGITIDANTWQHDFTVRLAGIDERERVSNRDIFGRACFFGSAMQLQKVNDTGGYSAAGGLAYIEGLRIGEIGAGPTGVTISSLPATVWLDVVLERYGNDVHARWTLESGQERADYTDTTGKRHYCVPIANVATAGITDRRPTEPINGPLVKHFASRKSVADIEDGTTAAGKAKQLATARQIALEGDVTGQVSFDGTKNVSIKATLPDIVVAGAYSKVVINAKGQVIGSQALLQGDIPALDWSKINSGKPTTLKGYGIIDALRSGKTDQRPTFYSANTGHTWQAAALEVREARLAETSQSTWEYAPRIAFLWGGVAAGDIAMSSQGVLCWNGQPLYHTGNLKPDAIVPAGTLIQSFSRTTPAGTLRCNGAAVSRTTFAALFAAIGTLYGVGDGATTFNLPDTRGLFFRDVDDGRGFDPGRVQSIVQLSQNQSHTHSASTAQSGWHSHPGSNVSPAGEHSHTVPRAYNAEVGGSGPNFLTTANAMGTTSVTNAVGAHTHGLTIAGDGQHAHAVTVYESGGNESRPVNMALYTYIKY